MKMSEADTHLDLRMGSVNRRMKMICRMEKWPHLEKGKLVKHKKLYCESLCKGTVRLYQK